jgi:hypothetical protein
MGEGAVPSTSLPCNAASLTIGLLARFQDCGSEDVEDLLVKGG